MYSFNFLKKAFLISKKAHYKTFRRNGETYFLHPLRIALECRSDDYAAVALLHDVVEKSVIKLRHIKKIFGKDIAKDIDLLTHKKSIDSYDEYIKKIKNSGSERAKYIKLLDIYDNYHDCSDRCFDKYNKALDIFSDR